jgi:hypothetical protein
MPKGREASYGILDENRLDAEAETAIQFANGYSLYRDRDVTLPL